MGGAYAEFAVEMRGGYTEQDKKRLAKFSAIAAEIKAGGQS